MATLKEAAKEYTPGKTKNIADLEAVSVSQEIKRELRKNNEGEAYNVSFIVVEGEEYRVPNSVLEQLQTIMNNKEMKTFKVDKKGDGLNTRYTVIQLE